MRFVAPTRLQSGLHAGLHSDLHAVYAPGGDVSLTDREENGLVRCDRTGGRSVAAFCSRGSGEFGAPSDLEFALEPRATTAPRSLALSRGFTR